jgi:hypothetical protein
VILFTAEVTEVSKSFTKSCGKPDVDPETLSVAPEGTEMVSPDWPTVIVPVPVLLSMVSTFSVLILCIS